MNVYNGDAEETFSTFKNKLRPNANNGLWLIALLPAAVIHCHLKYPQAAFQNYKLASAISLGMFCTSVFLMYQSVRKKEIYFNALYTAIAALTSTMVYAIGYSFLFSFFSGIWACSIFYLLFKVILYAFPKSFTLGEAVLVAQAVILFTYIFSLDCMSYFDKSFSGKMNVSTLIIQFGLLGIGFLCFLVGTFEFFRSPIPFYIVFCISVIFVILLPLHVILKESALLWIVYWVIEDTFMIKYMLYVVLCTTLAVFAVNKQISLAKKASTRSRKIFHVLAVLVYVPGLLYECTFLYLASAVTLGIFMFLELLRICNVPPLGKSLQDGFSVFCDEKDSGPVALTPIYLLISVSLPIWLHPTPCDMTDSAGMNLLPMLSGILSIGVGDTAASVVGKTIGRFKWPGTDKTVEGTLGYILSQVLFVYGLVHLGLLSSSNLMMYKVGVSIISTSLIEAFTSQVDNLALPLLMFNILL